MKIPFTKHAFDFDLIILGSGSAGSVAAHYARSLKKRVAICEENKVGGESPNLTCLPTKAVLHAGNTLQVIRQAKKYGISVDTPSIHIPTLKQWKDAVISRSEVRHGTKSFTDAGITVIPYNAHFISPHEIIAGEEKYSAAKFLIATGAHPLIPTIPGLKEAGYLTYQNGLEIPALPPRMVIYGGGETACEMGQLFAHLGTKVTIVTRSLRLLEKEDQEISKTIQKIFTMQDINIITGAEIMKIEKRNSIKSVFIKREGKEFVGDFEEILIANGKIPNLNFHPQNAKLAIKDKKLVVKKTLQTNVPHIYAAGDVIGNPEQVTNISSLQSYVAAQNIFTQDKVIPDYSVVPRCIFTAPETATVGLTEKEAKKNKKLQTKTGLASLNMLTMSLSHDTPEGFVKIITDKKGVILGGSIVAPRAGEMIHEIALAIKCRVTAEELADMVHVHPSYSEGIKVACSMVK